MGGSIMLKKIEYEVCKMEDVIVDLSNEIKNGWIIYSIGCQEMHFGCYGEMNMTFEITLRKE
jgi:hypothetical protein